MRDASELKIKLEVRQGGKVKKQIWKEYSPSFIDFDELFTVLKEEIEMTLPHLKRR